MILYSDYILKYPVFSRSPYTEENIQEKLDEIAALYPQIDSCLPESVRDLATKYAMLGLFEDEAGDCYGGKQVLELQSLDDKVVYKLGSGDPFALSNNTWGAKLIRMFVTHGCYIGTSAPYRSACGDCVCG